MSAVISLRYNVNDELIIRIPPPNARQRLFLADAHRFVGFGGARGGGKSWAVRTKAVILSEHYPGIRIMIMRRTYKELEGNHIRPLLDMLGEAVKYNETKKLFSFPNGSIIQMGFAQNEKDLQKYQGHEYDILFIDEATQFTEQQFDILKAIIRGTNSFPKRMYLTCNPGGVGHQWVKRLFIDGAFKAGEKPEDYSFHKALVTDNKALLDNDPEYVEMLESLPPKLRKAWLEGDWDVYEGQFFEDFRVSPSLIDIKNAGISKELAVKQRRFVHVIEPFEIPKDWKIYRSFDFGFAKPFSCDWWAVDYDGVAYLILQLYGVTKTANEGVKWDPEKIFSEISSIEREHRWLRGKYIEGVADPSIFDASRGESIAEVADKYRIFFSPGDNTRLPGWMQCHYRLKFDKNGYPMVYFFNTCKDAIRTLPLLQYDEHKPEDLDTKQEDHFADSFRYFCMFRPIAPVRSIEPTAYGDDPLDLRRG